MRYVIRKIDRAIKTLYRLENAFDASQFLVTLAPKPTQASPHASPIGNALGKGALLIHSTPEPAWLELGLYFDRQVRSSLEGFEKWPRAEWTPAQTEAFSVAVEEVSHFNYLVERAGRDQPVSALELEVQGEVDRFLLAFLAERLQRKTPSFEEVFERFFEKFSWAENLEPKNKERYEHAHRVAKSWIVKMRPLFKNHSQWSDLLAQLRTFYHLGPAEKFRSAQR